MGKMKISNNKKRNNGGMPSWLLSLIVGLVALIVVGTCLASFVGSTGAGKTTVTNLLNLHYQPAHDELFLSDGLQLLRVGNILPDTRILLLS